MLKMKAFKLDRSPTSLSLKADNTTFVHFHRSSPPSLTALPPTSMYEEEGNAEGMTTRYVIFAIVVLVCVSLIAVADCIAQGCLSSFINRKDEEEEEQPQNILDDADVTPLLFS